MVAEKATGKPVGSCGLYQRGNLDHPDIGFAFLPDSIGKGYGWEAASALKNDAFRELKLNTLLGFTLPENNASRKLLEKLGLQLTGTFQFAEESEELQLYSLENPKRKGFERQ